MKIQIVDDEPTWREFAAETLTAAGHQIVEAGADLALVSSLKLDALPGCPFVVFTGQWSTTEAVRVYNLGADDYVVKDFRAEVLLAAITPPDRQMRAANAPTLPGLDDG